MPGFLRFCLAATTISLLAILLLVWGLEPEPWMVLGLIFLLAAPLWLPPVQRLWRWIARQDVFSPIIAFPLAYVAWFTSGSIDFVQLPSFIGFGAFDPMPYRVLAYAGIGLGGYLLGAITCLRVSQAHQRGRVSAFYLTWEPATFRLALLVLILVMVGTYAYIAAHIGLPILSPNVGEDRLELGNYHWAGTPFFASAYTVIFLLLAKMWMDPPVAGSKTRWWMIGMLVAIFLVFLSMAGRAILVPPLLTGVILYHYMKRTLRLKSLIKVIVLLFAFLSVFGYLRDRTMGEGAMTSLEDAGLPRSVQPFLYCYLYVRYSVATLRDVSAIIPSQAPYQYGAITLLPLQSVLPGHHEMADMFFKRLLGNDFIGAGQPATLLGAFYADLGPVGIFVGMFLWGGLLAKLYRWMLWERSIFAAMIFAWAMQAGLFGIFGGVFAYLDTLVIPLCWVVLNSLLRTNRARAVALSPA